MVLENEKKNEKGITIDERLSHIAFIMDGNGRWAQKRGLPRIEGHKVGARTFRAVAAYCHGIGIRYVTVYAFSTENWKRPPEEVHTILNIIEAYVDECLANLIMEKAHIAFIGNLSVFSTELQKKMERIDRETAHNKFHLNIAVNYGGREEILQAYATLVKKGKTDITEVDLADHLYTKNCPDPDLIVRTGGDVRTSNFLLWQSAYAEYHFTDVLWPDYTERDVDAAVAAFYSKHRRFGGV